MNFPYVHDSTTVRLLPTSSFRDGEPPPPGRPRPSPLPQSKSCRRVIINMGNGRTKQGHRCTVDCLNRYPIHHAARVGRFKDLKKLLDQYRKDREDPDKIGTVLCCPLEQDECLGRSPLHYAAATGNVEKGYMCVKLLLENCAGSGAPEKRTENLRRFVNATDYTNETALHLAARNEATTIVKELLLHQADLDICSLEGKCCLEEVYKRTPLAMNEALNQSIAYAEFCRREIIDDEIAEDPSKRKVSNESDEIDFSHSYVGVCLNFYPLLGSKINRGRGKDGAPVPETRFLYQINRNKMESEVRRLMLNNVLVQAFLHFKWNKIKLFCYIAIFLHILWLALYIGIVIDVFVANCPFVTTEGKQEVDSSEKVNHTKMGTAFSDGSENDELELEKMMDGKCRVNNAVYISSGLLMLFSMGIAIKELFQFIRLRSLYIRFENFGQCMLLTFIFMSTPYFYIHPVIQIEPIHYQVSAFGIFLAWTLFLCQLAKLPRFCIDFSIFGFRVRSRLPDHGIYVEILSRVFKNFLVFICIFSSLLISFVFSFNILLPNSTGFTNLSNSIVKVLTMMTGELNYDDIFHSEDEKEQLVYPVASHVMYALFIMVATIILFNLLIGFTVSDIQGLQKDAEVNQIGNKLEQIFLMECFLLSTPVRLIVKIFFKLFGSGPVSQRELLSSIMVTRRTHSRTWYCYHSPIKHLPTAQRVAIRDWASRNCVPITELTGARSNIFQSSFTRR